MGELGPNNGISDYSRIRKDVFLIMGALLFSLTLYNLVALLKEYLYFVFSSEIYLAWHMLLEFMSIIMAFSIFNVTYYTFEHSKRLSSIIIACTFLLVALLDLFHTFSYKGMPAFVTESSAAKATTFWILARLIAASGLLAASLTQRETKMPCYPWIAVMLTLVLSAVMFVIVTFCLDFLPALFIDEEGLTPTKIWLEYVIIGIQMLTGVIYGMRYLKHRQGREYVLMIAALIVSVFSELAFTSYRSVYDTYNLLGHIYKIIAYYMLFRALFVINLKKPYQELHRTEQKLSAYVDNLERLVEERTREITNANKKLMKNLDDARNIQVALMTPRFPKVPGLQFCSKYMPCEKVGGDFYNVFRLDEDNVGILIGDVAGHGVSAAMVNVFISQNMRFKVAYEDGKYRIFTPRGVLMNLYHVFNEMNFPDEIYVVLFYCIYNIKTRELSYASAGMNTHPLILGRSGQVRIIPLDGFPICRLGESIKPSYQTRTMVLDPGDTLIFYSDGLGEIDRERPELFSQENIVEFIKGMKDVSASQLCDDLATAYISLLEDREMQDDVTILVVKTDVDDV